MGHNTSKLWRSDVPEKILLRASWLSPKDNIPNYRTWTRRVHGGSEQSRYV